MKDTLENRDACERLVAGLLMVGFPGHSVPDATADLISRGVRGFILFAQNIASAEQVRTLNAQLRALAPEGTLIGIDHEGGRVNRLRHVATPWPAPMAWSATGDLDLIERASAAAARELGDLGFNLNFAPVTDVLGDHRNPVLGTRCFSDDPATVAHCATAFIDGHHRSSVAATAKHFPGHGSTSVDSHIDMPEVGSSLQELERGDLIPFRAAAVAGVDCLMISHIWYSGLDEHATPATLSERVVDLARRGLGYNGVIVTDCMEMGAIRNRMSTGEAVVRAIRAGVDLAVVSHSAHLQQEALQALTRAVRDGTLPLQRVLEANQRLDALRSRPRAVTAEHSEGGEALARRIARESVTLVRDRDGVIPLRLGADETVGVVTFSPQRGTGVDNPRIAQSHLGEITRTYYPNVREVQVDMHDPGSVLDALQDVEAVIVGTAFATGHPRQREVVEALLKGGKRTIVLALSDPFDLLSFPDAPCYLALYGDTTQQLDAALAVLAGQDEACGRLPVTLGDLDPRGHGIQRSC